MKTKAGKRQNFFICQRSKARWDLFPLPPIICKYSWEKVVGVVWREEIVSIFMWKLLQQPVAVYWLNEFNLLQFLFSFFPITFEKDFFSCYHRRRCCESNQYFFQCVIRQMTTTMWVRACSTSNARFKHFYGQFELSSSLWQQFTSNSNWEFRVLVICGWDDERGWEARKLNHFNCFRASFRASAGWFRSRP